MNVVRRMTHFRPAGSWCWCIVVLVLLVAAAATWRLYTSPSKFAVANVTNLGKEHDVDHVVRHDTVVAAVTVRRGVRVRDLAGDDSTALDKIQRVVEAVGVDPRTAKDALVASGWDENLAASHILERQEGGAVGSSSGAVVDLTTDSAVVDLTTDSAVVDLTTEHHTSRSGGGRRRRGEGGREVGAVESGHAVVDLTTDRSPSTPPPAIVHVSSLPVMCT